MQPVNTDPQHTAPFGFVATHFVFSLFGLFATLSLLVIRLDDLGGPIISGLPFGLAHTAVLIWLLPVAVGALYQMLPVLADAPPAPRKLSWLAFGLYALGSTGLVAHLLTLNTSPGLVATAGLTLAGILLHVGLLHGVLAKARKKDESTKFVRDALSWLATAVILGLLLALSLRSPLFENPHFLWMPIHVHLAAFGFFAMMAMGVVPKLTEMFLVAHGPEGRSASFGRHFGNLAMLFLLAGGFGLIERSLEGAALFMALSVIAFLIRMKEVFQRRLKKQLDAPWRYTQASFFWLSFSVGLGIWLVSGLAPIENDSQNWAYATAFFFGFLGNLILGQQYKILPFLVWLHRFSDTFGEEGSVSAQDLVPKSLKRLEVLLWNLGVSGMVVSFFLSSSSVQWLAVCSLAFAGIFAASSLFGVLLRRPRP